MPDFLSDLLSPGHFIPHGHCYLWQTPLVGLHIISDGFTALAYYSIPFSLAYLARQRKDLPYPWIFWLFSAFIIACGTTHWMEIVTLWHPIYWVAGAIKGVTALVSVWTALTLLPLLPHILALPSPEQLRIANTRLEKEIQERQVVEAALRESERRYANLAESVPVGIFRFNQAGDCIYVNSHWCQMTGRPSEAAMGTGWVQTIHPDDQERIGKEWSEWLYSHEPKIVFNAEARIKRPDNTILWYLCQLKAEFGPDNTLIGYVGSLTDISDRKQIEQSLRKSESQLKEAQEIAHIGSWEFDAFTSDITWSDEIFRIYGLVPGPRVPSYEHILEHHFPPKDREQLHQAVQRALEHREPYELNLQIIRADGSLGWILAKGKPILDVNNRVLRLIGIALDTTKQKQAEAEQQKLNQMKDDFLSTVSHELRSPLTSIKMSVRLLEAVLDRFQVSLKEKIDFQEEIHNVFPGSRIKQYLAILNEQCQQELSLVNDLLELQRLEAQAVVIELEEIDLVSWLAQVIEPYYERTQSRNQVLEVYISPDLPRLMLSREIITRMLNELLTNACKYTPPGEVITVQVEVIQSTLKFSIRNNGVEIRTDELNHIFDRFYRIPQSDRWNQGGTGLGLALVKRQVDYLKGSIYVSSEMNSVQFIVELNALHRN